MSAGRFLPLTKARHRPAGSHEGWRPCSQGSPPRLPHRVHSDCRRACSRESVWIGERRSGRGAPWFKNRQHDSRRLRSENRSTGRQPPEGFDPGRSPNAEQNGESSRVATIPSSLTPDAVQRAWELARHHLPGTICPEPPFGPQVRAPRPAAPMSVSAAVSDSRQPQNRSQRSELDSATSCFPASPQ